MQYCSSRNQPAGPDNSAWVCSQFCKSRLLPFLAQALGGIATEEHKEAFDVISSSGALIPPGPASQAIKDTTSDWLIVCTLEVHQYLNQYCFLITPSVWQALDGRVRLSVHPEISLDLSSEGKRLLGIWILVLRSHSLALHHVVQVTSA